MSNTKILVCCHKPDVYVESDLYMPIHVGKALSQDDLGIQGDDTGDNISHKNTSYCELTGLYWAWKNLPKDVEIVGLSHYRRYFDFHGQGRKGWSYTVLPSDRFASYDKRVPDKVMRFVEKGGVVVASPLVMRMSLFDEYRAAFMTRDVRILEDVLKEHEGGQYFRAWEIVMHRRHKLNAYNMFLMRRDLFDEYCAWLFPILEKVEALTDIEHYDAVQRRIYGYMGERLLDVWIRHKNLRQLEYPVVMYSDTFIPVDLPPWKAVGRDISYSLSFFFTLPPREWFARR